MEQPGVVGQDAGQFVDEQDRLRRLRLALAQKLALFDKRIALVFERLKFVGPLAHQIDPLGERVGVRHFLVKRRLGDGPGAGRQRNDHRGCD